MTGTTVKADQTPASVAWWLVILIGTAAVVVGFYLFVFPAKSALVLTQVLAFYLLVDSVLRIARVIVGRTEEQRALNLAVGGLGLLIGIVVFGAPVLGFALTTTLLTILLYVIAVDLVIVGIIASIGAIAAWRQSEKAPRLLLAGVLGFMFGFVLLGAPMLGVSVALVRIIGAVALLYGGAIIREGIRLRRDEEG